MKQILHTFLASCLWVILGSGLSFAQGTQYLNAVSGQLLEIPVSSSPQRPIIQILPNHGVASFRSSGTRAGAAGNDLVDYIPTTGYYGADTLLVQSWTPTPYPRTVRTTYVITVGPSVVVAHDDYATTPMGTTLSIAATANDTGTFGNLSLASINSVSSGVAGIQGNAISFSPESGFKGIVTITYSVCDLLSVCDGGTVRITVYDPNPSNDTLHIQVPKNGEQVVLIDEQGYPLTTPPAHGTLSGSMPKVYEADANYVGLDEFQWSTTINGQTYTKQVYVEVLDVPPGNQYAVDDEAFISQNTTAYIDVKANDTQGGSLSGFAITGSPQNGTASIQNGVIVYTPNYNFFGLDVLTYRVFPPGYSGPAEYATVEIFVSDLPPAEFDFYLETPKNTPLVLDYPIPLSNYAFGIDIPLAQHGVAAFYPTVDTTIAGYDVVGERLVVYNPTTDFVGQDEVVASYCITSNGNCVLFRLHIDVLDLTPPAGGWCVQQCVWPGDTDNNGLVELADLLPIGECHGSVGFARSTSSSTWMGLPAPSWTQTSTMVEDLKYVDADGDGVISAADTTEIVANLGRYHKPYAEAPARLSPLPLFIEFPFDTLYAGDVAYFNLLLGTETFYAEDIYGFTYDLNYATSFIVDGSQRLIYDENSWISYAAPTLSLTKDDVFGELQTAFTLADGQARTGYGRIARFEFIVDEDLIGIRPSPLVQAPNEAPSTELLGFADFTIANASASLGSTRYVIAGDKVSIPVARRRQDRKLQSSDLLVFPNPATVSTRVHLNGAERIDKLRVFNELGQVVSEVTPGGVDVDLDLNDLAPGVYTIEVFANGEALKTRFVKQ